MHTALAAYLHTIDPYALKLWDGGPIRWYGLSYLFGFLLAYLLVRRVARAGRSTLEPDHAGDFILSVSVGIILGGRLGYVVFYQPQMLWTFTSNPPFWDMLAINKGGMASHGGMIGALLAGLYYARRGEHRPTHLFDLVAFAAPPGLLLGRLANFVNGELIGRPCSPDLPWAVKFPQEMFTWGHRHLAKLDQAVGHLLPRDYPIGYYIPDIVTQIQLGNQQFIDAVGPLLTPRHPSQIYQGLLEGVVLFAILAFVWRKPRKPGVVGALFCIAYAVLRIVSEYFREPDAHLGLRWLDLTRGQWLSVALLAVGALLLFVFSQRDTQPMGGWRFATDQASDS